MEQLWKNRKYSVPKEEDWQGGGERKTKKQYANETS